MISFGPEVALAVTVSVALLIAVAFTSYKRGYFEGSKAGRAYERKYGERGIEIDGSDAGAAERK